MDTCMFLTSAASKTKRAREESFVWANIAKHCVCKSLFKSLSGDKHAAVYITRSLLVDLTGR